MVALANIAGLQKVTQFALEHLWQPGDAIHEIYVEDSSAAGEPDLSRTDLQQGPMRNPRPGKIEEPEPALGNVRGCRHLCQMVAGASDPSG